MGIRTACKQTYLGGKVVPCWLTEPDHKTQIQQRKLTNVQQVTFIMEDIYLYIYSIATAAAYMYSNLVVT